MYNVNDVIGMNFKDEKQARNRMKIIIICICRSDDDDVERSRMRKRQVMRCEEVKKGNSKSSVIVNIMNDGKESKKKNKKDSNINSPRQLPGNPDIS